MIKESLTLIWPGPCLKKVLRGVLVIGGLSLVLGVTNLALILLKAPHWAIEIVEAAHWISFTVAVKWLALGIIGSLVFDDLRESIQVLQRLRKSKQPIVQQLDDIEDAHNSDWGRTCLVEIAQETLIICALSLVLALISVALRFLHAPHWAIEIVLTTYWISFTVAVIWLALGTVATIVWDDFLDLVRFLQKMRSSHDSVETNR